MTTEDAGASDLAPSTGSASDGGDKTPAESQAAKVIEAEIAPILEDLGEVPEETRQRVLHKIEESLTAFIATSFSTGPKMDPESVRILTETVRADNDNKFKFLTQREQHDSEHRAKVLDFERERHRSHVDVLKPTIFVAIFLVTVSLLAGLWFVGHGQECLGGGLLSATATAVFGFLGGLGVSGVMDARRRRSGDD